MSKRILLDFYRGLTVFGLARKYGKTKLQIEGVLRRWLRKPRKPQ